MILKPTICSIFSILNSIVMVLICVFPLSARAEKLEVHRYDIIKPFLDKHCVSCHGPEKQKGKFRVDTLGKFIKSQDEAEDWQEMLDLINSGEMPPPEKSSSKKVALKEEDWQEILDLIRSDKVPTHTAPVAASTAPPTDDELAPVLDALYKTTTNARDIISKMKAGKMRRMNRREYINTVQDRLGIRPKEELLPVDPGDFGFDTFREELVMTPTQLESYMSAGKELVDRLVKTAKSQDKMNAKEKYIFGDLSPYMVKVATRVKTQKSAAKYESVLGTIPDSAAGPIFQRYVALLYQGREAPGALVSNMMTVFKAGRACGMNFWESLVDPMVVALSSPNFIYLIEKKQELTQIEIANRMALLLWGAASPDKELIDLAKSNQLMQQQILASQVLRMLKDEKAERFYNSFIDQWLELERLDLVVIDEALFPDVAKNQSKIANSMRGQVRAYLKELLSTNSPASLLASSDFTMIDPLLAKYYGLKYPGKKGGFKKITLKGENRLRSGILGTGAIQMLTSTGTRTSPVERGVYILRKFLDRSPPPAPADVPEIEDDASVVRSTRELLAHHSTTVQCAACHDRIDPLGFGMESFGPMGRLQSFENEHAKDLAKKILVDTTGRMPNGDTFSSFAELQKRLVEQEEQIARTYVKALMSYALGRPIGFADREGIDQIIEKSRPRNFALAELTFHVCASTHFKMKN